MKIDMQVYEGWKRAYTLVLSQEDFAHFCMGCPELECIQGRYGRVYFQIYNGIRVPDAFRPLPDNDGYAIAIGAAAPIPKQGISSQEFDRLTDIYCENLRKALIEKPFSLLDRTGTHLGQVVLKIEE